MSPGSELDPRFGAVEAFRAADLATKARVCWTRIVFWWSGLQPDGPDSWNPFFFGDDLLQGELDAGRCVVAVLISTPAWAGSGSPNSVPHGLDLPPTHPDNQWARFCERIAETYRGRIDHWVIWNEPDINDPQAVVHTWDGTVEQFYRLQKVGYIGLKRGNPGAQVALPGLTYWWDPEYFERLLQVAEGDPEAPANNWFFDAAVLQLYDEPAGLFRIPMLFRQQMAARGIERSIWINETNARPWDDPQGPMPQADSRVTLDEQASYLVQAFAWALAAGAEHISVYPFTDPLGPAPGQEAMGLIRSDGSERPAYRAFQTITQYFQGVRQTQAEETDHAVHIVLDRETDTVTVVWSRIPATVELTLPARSDQAVLVDKFGAEAPLTPVEGVYQLTLEPATANTVNDQPDVYFVGGNPLLVVESATPSFAAGRPRARRVATRRATAPPPYRRRTSARSSRPS